jgi:hypothetical protein
MFQKYFSMALESSVLKASSGLAPGSQSHVVTKHKLLFLVKTYSKVIERIGSSMDTFKRKLKNLLRTQFLKKIKISRLTSFGCL